MRNLQKRLVELERQKKRQKTRIFVHIEGNPYVIDDIEVSEEEWLKATEDATIIQVAYEKRTCDTGKENSSPLVIFP
jgi:hypothetical protein